MGFFGGNESNKALKKAQKFTKEQLNLGITDYGNLATEGREYVDPFYQAGMQGLGPFTQNSLNNPYLQTQQGIYNNIAGMNPNIGLGQLPNAQIGNQFQAGQTGVTQQDILNDPSFNLMKDLGMENSAKRAAAMGMRNSSSRLGADNQAIRDAALATRDRIGQDQRFNIDQDWQAQQANYGRDADTYGNQMNQAVLGYQTDVDNYNRQAGQFQNMYNMQGDMGATQMGLLGDLTNMGLGTGSSLMNSFENQGLQQLNSRLQATGQNAQLAGQTQNSPGMLGQIGQVAGIGGQLMGLASGGLGLMGQIGGMPAMNNINSALANLTQPQILQMMGIGGGT